MREGTLEAETTLTRPDGGIRQIEFVATANVRPGRHIAVVRDLSRQKELESQLRQAQKMEAVGRLAGGIAHDFNNLLTAISGYSEFLIGGTRRPAAAPPRRGDQEGRRRARRSLTGQLLAFSRRQVLQPRVLDLNAVVSRHGHAAAPPDRRGRRARDDARARSSRRCAPTRRRSSR